MAEWRRHLPLRRLRKFHRHIDRRRHHCGVRGCCCLSICIGVDVGAAADDYGAAEGAPDVRPDLLDLAAVLRVLDKARCVHPVSTLHPDLDVIFGIRIGGGDVADGGIILGGIGGGIGGVDGVDGVDGDCTTLNILGERGIRGERVATRSQPAHAYRTRIRLHFGF